MRYVPANCLRVGMILGNNIYSEDGAVLLAKDVALTDQYIESLHKLMINGLYIEDGISSDIQVEHVISEELRVGAVKTIRDIYNNPKSIVKSISLVESIARKVVDEVLNNKSVMINMVDIKTLDNQLYSHSVNVGVLSTVLGIALNFDISKLEKLAIAAFLHDIGKVFIPKEILMKTTKLTESEEEIFKKHSEKGYRYIKDKFKIPITSYVAILQHHEQFDGKGYPDKKTGEDISIFARIIALCNTYDELVSGRPNREACLPSEAIEYVMANSGTLFDPKLVKLFLRKVAPYPIGTIVKLSNGESAIVLENNEECSIRPKVRTLEDQVVYDLTNDVALRTITIVGVDER